MVNAPLNETGGYLWSCNFMIRRDVFEQFRFDEDYPMPAGEDVDFRQRLIQAGLKFPFVREALVVHPPRRQRFGVAQARLHESAFIAWHKARTQPPSWIKYILRLGKHRTINILKFRPSLDSGIAVVSVAVEIAAIVCFYPKWKRRHGIDPHSPR